MSADRCCICSQPAAARCEWRMHTWVTAGDNEEAQRVLGDGTRQRREYSGQLCGLALCEDHANLIPSGGKVCRWHFKVGKEERAIPAEAPPAPAYRVARAGAQP